jgi:hypothetical protein
MTATTLRMEIVGRGHARSYNGKMSMEFTK